MMHGGIDEYVHRIGRTARIGHKGLASSFFTERDAPLAEKLVPLLKAYADGTSLEEGGEVQPEGDDFGGDNAEPDGFKPDGDNNEASGW